MRHQLRKELGEELSRSVPESKGGNDGLFGEPKEPVDFVIVFYSSRSPEGTVAIG